MNSAETTGVLQLKNTIWPFSGVIEDLLNHE